MQWDIIAKKRKWDILWNETNHKCLTDFYYLFTFGLINFLPDFIGYTRMEKSYLWMILWIMVQIMLTC